MIAAPRSIVIVHGVQWERNAFLKGYSRPLTLRIQGQAPSTRFDFREVLWSDVVEPLEQLISRGVSLASLAGAGSGLLRVTSRLAQSILQRQDDPAKDRPMGELFDHPLRDVLANDANGFLHKALSAVLDVILYESGLFRAAIQKQVTDVLDEFEGKPAPILYGHSLGAQIAFDVLANANRQRAFALVTSASPLGLLRRRVDDGRRKRLRELDWVNYYDTDDFLAFWNPLRLFGYREFVTDRSIDASEVPFYSHIKYWGNSAISRELADLATTEDSGQDWF